MHGLLGIMNFHMISIGCLKAVYDFWGQVFLIFFEGRASEEKIIFFLKIYFRFWQNKPKFNKELRVKTEEFFIKFGYLQALNFDKKSQSPIV